LMIYDVVCTSVSVFIVVQLWC